MSELAAPQQTNEAPRPSARALLWFVWMEATWVVFFALLFAAELTALWDWIRDLPLVVELVLWVAFLPWMLGMTAWDSSWSTWVRLASVLVFLVGWSVVSIPRPQAA